MHHSNPMFGNRRTWLVVAVVLAVAVIGLVLSAQQVVAHSGGNGGESGPAGHLCEFDHPEWREAQTVAGVRVQEDRQCRPDNPYRVAAFVNGTNSVPTSVLRQSGLAEDAVVKYADQDGDGDPDVVHVTLEVTGVNEYNAGRPSHQIAPGVNPPMWTFSPKGRGMVENGSPADVLTESVSPSIRAEANDTVYVTVENTHYMPHTIHFHGVDHPFERQNGQGNDGVPQTSERPIQPGERRTYQFTPEQAGTMLYHCHVVPDVHVQMGLSGQFIVEKNRSDNRVQTLNVGAGKVRHPSKAVRDNYSAEFDLQYQALDAELAAIADRYNHPSKLATAFNRRYDATDATVDYFLLNGESFPYTLHDSMVIVEPGERYKLHVSNVGPGTVSLHTHGHKVNVTATDGVRIPEKRQPKRDVVSVSPAQRVTLALNTTVDGLNSYGPGVWFVHDHREKSVTTDGISPGGAITMITYESYLRSNGMPATNTGLDRYFNASYYDGEIPVFEHPRYNNGTRPDDVTATAVNYGVHDRHAETRGMAMRMTDNGTVVNEVTAANETGCPEVHGARHVTVRAGTDFAEDGEVFGYSREHFEFEPCTRVTVTLVNEDNVRHQWMVHGLPDSTYSMGMFNIEATNRGSVTGTFVTPPDDRRLQIHCSLPQHEVKGMHGTIVVGDPRTSETVATSRSSTDDATPRSAIESTPSGRRDGSAAPSDEQPRAADTANRTPPSRFGDPTGSDSSPSTHGSTAMVGAAGLVFSLLVSGGVLWRRHGN